MNIYGYDEEEWETLPDETRDEIVAEYHSLPAPEAGSCGCMGGTD